MHYVRTNAIDFGRFPSLRLIGVGVGIGIGIEKNRHPKRFDTDSDTGKKEDVWRFFTDRNVFLNSALGIRMMNP